MDRYPVGICVDMLQSSDLQTVATAGKFSPILVQLDEIAVVKQGKRVEWW